MTLFAVFRYLVLILPSRGENPVWQTPHHVVVYTVSAEGLTPTKCIPGPWPRIVQSLQGLGLITEHQMSMFVHVARLSSDDPVHIIISCPDPSEWKRKPAMTDPTSRV